METVFLGMAALGCPIGMGAMMWFMSRGMKHKSDVVPSQGVEALREEHRRLADDIAPLESADPRGSRSPS